MMCLFSPHVLRQVVLWEVAAVPLARLCALLMNSTLQPSVPSLVEDVQEFQDSIDQNCIVINGRLRCMAVSFNHVIV